MSHIFKSRLMALTLLAALLLGACASSTPAPAPAPTQTLSPNITFTANPSDITAGQAVLFHWATSNVKAVYFYHEGQDWRNHGVPASVNRRNTRRAPSTTTCA